MFDKPEGMQTLEDETLEIMAKNERMMQKGEVKMYLDQRVTQDGVDYLYNGYMR